MSERTIEAFRALEARYRAFKDERAARPDEFWPGSKLDEAVAAQVEYESAREWAVPLLLAENERLRTTLGLVDAALAKQAMDDAQRWIDQNGPPDA
jgi:hypothetical protein